MSYDLIYTRRAARDIARLNHETQLRIKGKLEQYRLAPFQHAEKLVTSELGSYRFRVGDYRVIFDIQDNSLIVLRVGHRREIYR
ncbi:type II toxin-antitoxin system RelE/ParE family toxin [candidate division KSB1 bacterium]|nr:MAG: type II toxin-antitoxin system RelE/ParE family toxin [candidate division KSB1 bacterium]MBC6948085.1 type II toxin-antitoxin system RelE/ParE family toxin [candidate division KSB1 bacterium]MCE7940052.1 type II toxin-antitoxin system RelE/ParE family toxin [Chlorobi bacterium CHB1]MDL1875737.1 type II toxin-antitoxin system RelE/ParE family toxin [Cytophagia bacterium CHB2]